MKRLVVAVVILTNVLNTEFFAQSNLFSQYYVTPWLINPSLTGMFKGDFRTYRGDYRLSSYYRSQWRSVTNNPYNTISVSGDMPIRIKGSNGFLGVGVSLYNDKAGISQLQTSQYNLSVSYNLNINKEHSFAAGIQTGYVQKTIKLTELMWDVQYDGANYDPSIPSGENLTAQKAAFVDIGSGISWSGKMSKNVKLDMGFAAFHVNMPNQSITKVAKDNLLPKMILHGSADIIVRETRSIYTPQLLISRQGATYNAVIGSTVKKVLGKAVNESRYTDYYISSGTSFGLFYRLQDAIILTTSFDYKQVLSIGFSYDVTISKLRAVSSKKGAWELSLTFKGGLQNSKLRVIK